MLYIIKGLSDPYSKFLVDDPVRPNIALDWRFGKNKFVYSLVDKGTITAVVCAKFCNNIPSTEEELMDEDSSNPNSAIFYTIWSYKPGSGRQLILESLDQIKKDFNTINRFVTLSPKTETARRFHLKNGAVEFRINAQTVNYEYCFN